MINPMLSQASGVMLETHAVGYTVAEQWLVDNVSFTLHAGEIIALVGPNGAGKTTLLRLLAGDLMPHKGAIMLQGLPLSSYNARAQALRRAVLRQQVGVAFPFSALDVVLMGRNPHLLHGRETADDTAIARRALDRTEALAFEQRAFPTLSGGEQTRVMLAKILAQEAPILLLDEPTAALDPRHQHAALQLARDFADEGGAVFAILHDLVLAASYADRIGVLYQGQLVGLGTPWDVLRADLLEQVYGVSVFVQRHPTLDIPLALVAPERRTSRTEDSSICVQRMLG